MLEGVEVIESRGFDLRAISKTALRRREERDERDLFSQKMSQVRRELFEIRDLLSSTH